MVFKNTKEEFLASLSIEVACCGSRAAFARKVGVSRAYISEICSGKKQPSHKILEAVGYRREVLYVKSTGRKK